MFSKQLRKYRKSKGLTQEDLAMKITEETNTLIKKINVSKWEQGVNPKIETIEVIATILDIPVQYLFDDSDQVINEILKNKYPNFSILLANIDNINNLIETLKININMLEKVSKI